MYKFRTMEEGTRTEKGRRKRKPGQKAQAEKKQAMAAGSLPQTIRWYFPLEAF